MPVSCMKLTRESAPSPGLCVGEGVLCPHNLSSSPSDRLWHQLQCGGLCSTLNTWVVFSCPREKPSHDF